MNSCKDQFQYFSSMDTLGTLFRIAMLDFSKAFDRIDFNSLLEKHRTEYILSLLTGLQIFLRIENKESE